MYSQFILKWKKTYRVKSSIYSRREEEMSLGVFYTAKEWRRKSENYSMKRNDYKALIYSTSVFSWYEKPTIQMKRRVIVNERKKKNERNDMMKCILKNDLWSVCLMTEREKKYILKWNEMSWWKWWLSINVQCHYSNDEKKRKAKVKWWRKKSYSCSTPDTVKVFEMW